MSEQRELEECLRARGWTDKAIEDCSAAPGCLAYVKKSCVEGGFPVEGRNDIFEVTLARCAQPGAASDVTLSAAGYESLAGVLLSAFQQASAGKGVERHASNGEAFELQPMQRIARDHGIGFITGQARKKLEEAVRMYQRGNVPAAEREFLGAINYLAGAIIFMRDEQ